MMKCHPLGQKKSQSCNANTLRTSAEKLKVKGGWTTIFDVVDGTWSKKNKSSRNRNIIVKGNTQVDTSSPWLQHTCRQRCSDVNTNSGRIRKMWVKEFVKPLSFHTSTRAESRCDRHLTHICPPCLNTWDKLHKEHYCLKRSSDRDSNPKYTKGAIFLLTVVPFIHLDCFGLSCWVLKMPAVEMSAFSRVKWNETSLGVWDARSAKNVKVWTYSSSRGSCSWLASLVSLHLSMSRGILPSAYWYGKKVGEHDEPSAI